MQQLQNKSREALLVLRRLGRSIRRSELGEGVISTAIAVLVMAFLGVAMWLGFKATLGKTQTKVDTQVCQIGSDNSAC